MSMTGLFLYAIRVLTMRGREIETLNMGVYSTARPVDKCTVKPSSQYNARVAP